MPPITSVSFIYRNNQPADAPGGAASDALGELPEWNLGDLYAAPDAPEVAADIETCKAEARALQDN